MIRLILSIAALTVLTACGFPEPKTCAMKLISTDPKTEVQIWEPVPCETVVTSVAHEPRGDGGKGFNPPTQPEPPKPDPEPEPEPCKSKCGEPDPQPEPDPCKGKCNGGDKPGYGHGDTNHDHNGPPGKGKDHNHG